VVKVTRYIDYEEDRKTA